MSRTLSPILPAPDGGAPAISHRNLSEEEFLVLFGPIPNHLNGTAGFDFGQGGCLFDGSGAELAFVRAQSPENVWTVIDGDDGMEITDGMHFVNRLGYLVTDRPCPPDTMFSVALEE